MTRKELGDTGESIVLNLIGGRLGKRGESDIVRNGVQIEVKTAKRGKDNKYRATLYKQGSQNHRKSDFVIFVILDDKAYFYLIPTKEIRHKNHLCITSHPSKYRGKYAQYIRSLECLSSF